MSCCTAKLDTCRLIQESFKSPTFDFGDLDISQDDITYKVKRNIDTKFTDYPVTKAGSLVFIDEYTLPIGKYNHEMTWVHNGDTILMFQGNLEITDKSKGCGCNDSNNKIIKVEINETIVKINYSENIIQVGKGGAIELVDTKLRVAGQDPNVFTEQGNYSFNATVFNPEQFGGTPIEEVPEEAKYGAKGEMSFSWNGRADGRGSVAMLGGAAYGDLSLSIGGQTNGEMSVALVGSTADGKRSMAVMGSTAREDYQFALGGYTDNIANTAVIVGAGEDVGKNRFMVYKDGGLGLLDTQTDAYKRVEVKDSKMLIDGIEVKGEKGDTGERGLQGIQGVKGDKGDAIDSIIYDSLTETQKQDVANRLDVSGVVASGNLKAVNGDKVYNALVSNADFLNISRLVNNFNFTSLLLAIQAVPSNYRKFGLKISFKSSGYYYYAYFNGGSLTTWENVSDWILITDYIFNVSFVKNSYNITPAAAKSEVPLLIRKDGLLITYKYQNKWVIEQFIGSVSTDWSNIESWVDISSVDYLNVSRLRNKFNYASLDLAIKDVPLPLRVLGLKMSFKSNGSYLEYVFNGASLATWETISDWVEVGVNEYMTEQNNNWII